MGMSEYYNRYIDAPEDKELGEIEIERITERAIFTTCMGKKVWIPKSQIKDFIINDKSICRDINVGDKGTVIISEWLYCKIITEEDTR